MENNEIMKRLMEDDNNLKSQQKSTNAKEGKKENETSLSRIRVVTAKYKVLTVLFLIFVCIFIFNLIPNIQSKYNNSKTSYDSETLKLKEIKSEIDNAKKDIKLLTWIVYNEQNLAECLNKKDSRICWELPKEWKTWTWEEAQYDLSIPLSYLQLHSLYNKKMPVDEKKVLKNLNEYLIKEDFEWTWRAVVWNILKIDIGDPEAIWYIKKNPNEWGEPIPNFFEVPVDVEIKFTEVDDLVGFLYNVEKKLIDKDKWNDRILYKIQTVSYDIIAKDEPQVTDISMLAYYYYDENFEGTDEYEYYFVDKSDNKSWDNSSDNNQINTWDNGKSIQNKESFLDKIFNF